MKRRTVGHFFKDRGGAFAIQFALMVVPLTAATGLAIDGGRAFLARFELSSALDSAALAVGSTSSDDNAVLNAVAQKFVDENFKQAPPGSVRLTLTPTKNVVTLSGTVDVDTVFMPIMGVNHVNVSAEAEVRRGGGNVEVALVLDSTGSMAGQRMTDLKAAAKDLVDIVVSDSQSPWYSRLALISYGDNVNAGAYADAVRGAPTPGAAITAADWEASSSKTVKGASWKDGGAKNISDVTRASRATVTAAGHGFANGDYLFISGVRGMTRLNSKIFEVADATANTFALKNPANGAYINSSNYNKYKSKGTLQKCFTADCEIRVSATGHGFSAGDFVHITGVNGMYQINNNDDETWTVTAPTSDTFVLAGSDGPSSSNYSSGGKAVECFTSECEIRISAAAHGLSDGERVYITGARGMSINTSGNNSWVVSNAAADSYILSGSEGPGYSDYTGSGTSWCLTEGCRYYRFTNDSGGTLIREISTCVSERIGTHAYDDTSPLTAPVGRAYAGSGYTGCRSYGAFEPLTDDKSLLKGAINDLQTDDSTAGQIGLAWGWYMLAPDWGYLWPQSTNRPHPYGERLLSKVLVLMTDGDFNTAYCNSVVSANYGIGSSSDRINCNATNGDPFVQAQQLCTNIKASGVTIYTVGFGSGLSNGGGDFLKACATSPSHAYLAATGSELKEAFRSIAKAISLLRLSR
jgi:Flp pilus assembly protein TadG